MIEGLNATTEIWLASGTATVIYYSLKAELPFDIDYPKPMALFNTSVFRHNYNLT